MLRLITAAGILAIASPIWAQDGAPTPGPESMSEPKQDINAPPPPTNEPVPSPTAEPTPAPAAAESNKEVQVKQVVEANFPTYDADQSGDLSAKEFDGWLTVLRQKSAEAKGTSDTMPEAEKKTWMKEAFAKADSDKSKKISKAELETFLMG